MTINSQNGNTLLQAGFFPPVRVATTGSNIVLSGLQTIDGVALAAGDRVLVKDQTDATANGIYAASSGTWSRSSDVAGNQQFFSGMAVLAALGTVNAGTIFVCTTTDDPVVVGTSLITFATQGSVQNGLLSATSATSTAVGTGSKTFTTQSGKNFAVNQWLLIWETSAPTNAMLAQITSYSGTSLVVSVTATNGSGTHADWSIALTGAPTTIGLVPPIGSGNVTGPGSSTATHLPTFADGTGKVLQDSGTAIGTLAGRNQVIFGDVAAGAVTPGALSPDTGPLPYIAGQPADNLVLSNDGSQPNRDIDISPGRVRDDSDATNLRLVATMVKRLDIGWVAGGLTGSPQGALSSDSSRLASKTYHIYLIGRLSVGCSQFSRSSNVATLTVTGHLLGVGGTIRVTGVGSGFDGVYVISAVADANHVSFANTGVDVGTTACSSSVDGFDILASVSYPSPAMPTGFSVKQCLGSILTDGSINNIAFTQFGDEFWLKTPTLDVNVTQNSGLPNASVYAISVPFGLRVKAMINAFISVLGATELAYFLPPGNTDMVPSGTLAPLSTQMVDIGLSAGSVNSLRLGSQAHVWTDTNKQIRLVIGTDSTTVRVCSIGWFDPRRRMF